MRRSIVDRRITVPNYKISASYEVEVAASSEEAATKMIENSCLLNPEDKKTILLSSIFIQSSRPVIIEAQ